MFFVDKIHSIAKDDRVLEIGPGGTPHPRANVFLELSMNENVAQAQRGGTPKLETDKPVVFYDGKLFPFEDREFDYVIASHVLEHVDDIAQFTSEMFRIAPKGYVEYPTIYYEYLYNFDVHLNLLKKRDNVIYYRKKSDFHFDQFKPIQRFFLEALQLGHSQMVDNLQSYMFEGFEWLKPFSIDQAESLEQLTWAESGVRPPTVSSQSSKAMAKELASRVKRKLLK